MTQPNQNNPQYNYQTPPQAAGPQPYSNQGPIPPQGIQPPRPTVTVPPIRRTKNKFLTFVFALIPGAGQMYHGLMKRGISLMLLFSGVIAVAAITYMPVIAVLTPIIWFYSFFDAVNRMNTSLEELRMLDDNYLFIGDTPKMPGKIAENNTFQKIFKERHMIFGWLLIVLAIWIFVNLLFSRGYWPGNLWYNVMPEEMYFAIQWFIDLIPSLIIPVLCVLIGVKLITGDHKKKQAVPPKYDEYTIPMDEHKENVQ